MCNQNADDPIRDYFLAEQSQVFAITDFSPAKAFFGKCVNVMATFVWTYMDLFVMLISVGLSTCFQQINNNLFTQKGNVRTETYIIDIYIDILS